MRSVFRVLESMQIDGLTDSYKNLTVNSTNCYILETHNQIEYVGLSYIFLSSIRYPAFLSRKDYDKL